MDVSTSFEQIDALLTQMVDQQRAKVIRLGQERHPGLTAEDLRNSQDFPELEADSLYNFEDGLLSGLMAAQTAIRSRRRQFGASSRQA